MDLYGGEAGTGAHLFCLNSFSFRKTSQTSENQIQHICGRSTVASDLTDLQHLPWCQGSPTGLPLERVLLFQSSLRALFLFSSPEFDTLQGHNSVKVNVNNLAI
jgi:hypothetical protein